MSLLDLDLDEAQLAQLPQHELAFLQWQMNWLATARPNQVPPEADPATGEPWSEFGALAGRGFGKTKMGAEWLARASYEDPEGWPSAVVCPTLSDVKKVAFQGVSGLLSVIPPDLVVDYNKSDFIITMRNIAGGTTPIQGFTSEKPESLRGPNHARAWCFAAGTPVRMADGSERPIESIRAGAIVATRFGPREVLAAGLSGNLTPRFTLDFGKTKLTCTADHPILTTRGWVEAGALAEGDEVWSASGTTERHGGSARTGTTATDGEENCCTDVFGRITSGLFQRATTFTTVITILATTTRRITRFFRTASIAVITGVCRNGLTSAVRPIAPGSWRNSTNSRFSNWFAFNAARATSVRGFLHLARFVAPPALTAGAILRSGASSVFVLSAGKLTTQIGPTRNSVRPNATLRTSRSERLSIVGRDHARSVASNLNPSVTTLATAPGLVLSKVRLRKIERESGPLAPVYDLTVKDVHEFIASGIVVHNCDEVAAWQYMDDTWDMLEMTLRVGPHPQIFWTTTPKPKPLIRRLIEPQKGRVLVRGTTHENKANLAPKFYEKLMRFEGTKLGDQEVYAELLDPEEAGIVKRSQFRIWPHGKPLPPFSTIIMSLDTAFTEKALAKENDLQSDTMKGDPDPTACTVWGVFHHEKRNNVMLLDAWEDHLGLPALVRRVKREMNCAYGDDAEPMVRPLVGPRQSQGTGRKPDILLIEDKGSGISLRQFLEQEGILAHAYNPGRADKLARLHIVSPVFARKLVWLPESSNPARKGQPANWSDAMVAQLCSFAGTGSIKHDDFVDSVTQTLRLCMDMQFLDTRPPAHEQRRLAEETEVRKAARGPVGNPYSA